MAERARPSPGDQASGRREHPRETLGHVCAVHNRSDIDRPSSSGPVGAFKINVGTVVPTTAYARASMITHTSPDLHVCLVLGWRRTSWHVSRILSPCWSGAAPAAPAAQRGGRPSISAYRCRQTQAAYPQASGGQPSNACAGANGSLLALLRAGFTEPPRSPGVLMVSYTTVSPLPDGDDRRAVCFLWHCPAGLPG